MSSDGIELKLRHASRAGVRNDASSLVRRLFQLPGPERRRDRRPRAMETLAQAGYEADVLCGSVLDVGREVNPADWLAEQGWSVTTLGGDVWNFDVHGVRVSEPAPVALGEGVRVTVRVGAASPSRMNPIPARRAQFLVLLDKVLARFRAPPGSSPLPGIPALAREFLRRAKARGAATLWILHNFPSWIRRRRPTSTLFWSGRGSRRRITTRSWDGSVSNCPISSTLSGFGRSGPHATR